MTRIPAVTEHDTDPDQRAVWDAIIGTRGDPSRLVGPDGGLVGPFNAMVTSPELGRRMADLGAGVRFHNELDGRLKELAICTTGARWKAEFEWWAHRRMGVEAGLAETVLDVLADGGTPTFERADEAIVHGFASQLAETGRVDDERFDAALTLLGPRAVVDLIVTVGYYSLISFTLNALRIPLPEGVAPVWDLE